MKVVALLAWKGGVGKSTLTINLAAAAIEDGHKVGIIDLDPQSSLSEWSDRREAEQPFVSDAKPRAVAQIVEAGRGLGLARFVSIPGVLQRRNALLNRRMGREQLAYAARNPHGLHALGQFGCMQAT